VISLKEVQKGELMVPIELCMVQTLSNLWLALIVLTNYHTRRPIPAGRSVSWGFKELFCL